MSQNPQDTIANLCAELLALVPGSDTIACALEFARRNLMIDPMLCALIDYLYALARDHAHEGRIRVILSHLHQLLDPGEPMSVTVAEIRDEGDEPIYRVTNAAGTQLHAWIDRHGWETTGWTLASDLDDIKPVPGREDMPRGAWPVGLAALVAKALDELDTAEPWDGEETLV